MRYLGYADIGTWSVWWSMSEAVKHFWSCDFYFTIYTYLKVNYFSLFLQLSPLILSYLFVLLVIYVLFSFQSVSMQFIWAYVCNHHSHWRLENSTPWNNLYGCQNKVLKEKVILLQKQNISIIEYSGDSWPFPNHITISYSREHFW